MNYRFMKTLISIALLAVLSSCHGQPGAQVLTAQAFETKLNLVNDKIILDVRTSMEYNRGHLAGASLLDYYQDNFVAQLAKLDKTKPVFVYCASGIRSNSAANELIRLGFKEVYDLRGGLSAWVRAGKAIVK